MKSQTVKQQNELIRQIDTSAIALFYNREDTIKNYRYSAEWVDEVDDYVISHIAKIKEAYNKAAVTNNGLVVRIG